MATEAQIAANRRNAQLSTGPRTEAGKSNARINGLQSGLYAESLLIPGEDPAELDALAAEYEAEYRPATATERDLVAMLVRSQWYMRRVSCIETDMWTIMLDDSDAMTEARRTNRRPRLHTAFEHFEMSLSRIQVRLNSLERSFHRALTQLRKLQAERPAPILAETPENCPAPSPEPIEPTTTSPQIGFAPANSSQPAAPQCPASGPAAAQHVIREIAVWNPAYAPALPSEARLNGKNHGTNRRYCPDRPGCHGPEPHPQYE